MPQTLGQIMLRDALPEDMRDDSRVFNKKQARSFFKELALKHPKEYVDISQKLVNMSRMAVTDYGGISSPSLDDLKVPEKVKQYRAELESKLFAIHESDTLNADQKNEAVVQLMKKEMPKIQNLVQKETFTGKNSLAEAIRHGFRGSPVQLTQLLFGDTLVADQKGRALPVPGLHGYAEGVTPMEYWSGAYGSRKGYADVQFMTAKAGFLGKQLALAAQRVQVTSEDCGADNIGLLASGDDDQVIGTVLARDIKDIPAGTTIEKKHLRRLQGQKVLVRSHTTCQARSGVCSKCSGKRNNNEFPKVGAYVGIDTGRLTSEPVTQAGLSSKHTGGIIKGKSLKEEDEMSGFDQINQFLQVPKAFKGAAALAPADAAVNNILDAPQGGKYIMLSGGHRIYAPPSREVTVKQGDKLEAGDILTDGTPNPAELAKLKGLGEGRVYFNRKFAELLEKNGINVHRRHVETMSRAFFDRVKITRPEGVAGYTIDDVATYSDIQRDYKPRKDASSLSPHRAVDYYLEKPVLHYTIGTRITPKIAEFMKEQKVAKIDVHREDPGFEPAPTRLMDIPGTDPNWKNKLTGFNIKKNLLTAARQGAEAEHDSVGYAAKLMDPTRL
jgi:DNA-directed RNA polymerase subunit beta'